MFFKLMILYFSGYVKIAVEGFFIEKFLNCCKAQDIYVDNINIRKDNTYLELNILKQDFKKIKAIAKKTRCKVRIKRKIGLPFFLNRYKKRKIYAIALIVIAIFIFSVTRFVWNIEIKGNTAISTQEVISILEKNGIKKGTFKYKMDFPKIINDIRKERTDISWLGIDLVGTTIKVNIQETIKEPEIIDKSRPCNIVADKDTKIKEIVVYKGTARVEKGQEVHKGDILVEGVMKSEVYGSRDVYADAVIIGEKIIEKEKKEPFKQLIKNKTGEKQTKREICINKFKIFFNKGVSKYKIYDTICTRKRLKISEKFYLPITIIETKFEEIIEEEIVYTEQELKDKITNELSTEIENENNLDKFKGTITKENVFSKDQNYITVKMKYILQEKIGNIEYK